MDNMKARAWLEARIPYFDPPPKRTMTWTTGPSAFRKRAAQSRGRRRRGGRRAPLPDQDRTDRQTQSRRRAIARRELCRKDAFADLIERFWRETETDFRNALARPAGQAARRQIKPIRETFLEGTAAQGTYASSTRSPAPTISPTRTRAASSRRAPACNTPSATRARCASALDIMTEEAKQKSRQAQAAKKKDAA